MVASHQRRAGRCLSSLHIATRSFVKSRGAWVKLPISVAAEWSWLPPSNESIYKKFKDLSSCYSMPASLELEGVAVKQIQQLSATNSSKDCSS
jgi:hypothetical protein